MYFYYKLHSLVFNRWKYLKWLRGKIKIKIVVLLPLENTILQKKIQNEQRY